MDLYKLNIQELKKILKSGEITPSEVVKSSFTRIKKVEDKVHAFLTLTHEKVLERVEEIAVGSLAGIPVAVKDNISTEGIRTSCSSKMLENYRPPYNASVIDKLNKAGAVIVGKTNMDEFAMGSSTENSAYFNTYNPWNLSTVPGGSSGGSAAAVASGEVPAALGSDTGGSIRQPASYCGVVGMKPTYGSVSRYGLIAHASSLEQIGPITRNVSDNALLLNVLCGHDPLDSTSVNLDHPDYTKFLKKDVKGMKIGLPEEYFSMDFNVEVREKVLSAVKKLKDAGAEVEEVNFPGADYALASYYIIAPAEASSNLARYDGVRYGYRSENKDKLKQMYTATRSEGFGDEVKRRIIIGTYVLSSGYHEKYYLKAQQARMMIKKDFCKLFKNYDLLISPTTPTTAFKVGTINDPLKMYQMDVFTVPVNIAGIPAISIPCGFDSNHMPVGLQIMGPHFGEGTILQAAYTLEEILDINDMHPEMEVG